MTPHNWEFISHEISSKVALESLDYNISAHELLDSQRGTYVCSRCGDTAAIYISKPGLSGISSNWDLDCDEYILHKVHDS